MKPLLAQQLRCAPSEADRGLLILVALNTGFAAWLLQSAPAAMWGAVAACALLAALVFAIARGRTWVRFVMTGALVGVISIQLHAPSAPNGLLGNVALSMVLLLYYRDWRVIALFASSFAAHSALHGVSELDEPITAAVFTVLQGLVLCPIAAGLHKLANEAMELEFLVNAMGRDGPIRLDLDVVRAVTPAGQRLKDVQKRMAQAMREVRTASLAVQCAADEVAEHSGDLRSRTDKTANELRESAMCLDQIGVIVRHSSEASNEAKTMSNTACEMAGEGGQLVTRVVETMREIETSSARIGDIIGVVDSIAFQTNILALNAAVEAARAGEQGRGFAVVASEVRALAQRSAQAAREIKALVGASSTTVEHGTKLVGGAGDTMASLVSSVRRVGELFESINADADDHAQGLQMVMQSMHDLTSLTRENVSVAERSSDIASNLQEQSTRLNEVMQTFRLGAGAASPHDITPCAPSPSAPVAIRPNPAPRTETQPARPSPATTNIEFF